MYDNEARNPSSPLAQIELPDDGSQRGSLSSRTQGMSPACPNSKQSLPALEQRVFPGNGICPSRSQFIQVFTSTYDAWKSSSSALPDDDDDNLFCEESFLELLEDIPAFRASPLERLRTLGKKDEDLIVECALQWKTTMHPECKKGEKTIKFHQLIGSVDPSSYSFLISTEEASLATYPGIRADRLKDFTVLVLTWSYILCSRWVEILRSAGERAFLRYENLDSTADDFWDLIIGGRWAAILVQNEAIFCAPWMLEIEDYVEPESRQRRTVSPDSFSAFDKLASLCAANGLEIECVIALIMVLTRTSEIGDSLRLPTPTKPSQLAVSQNKRDRYYDKLYQSLDRCVTLSCTLDGIDSLLCGVFFDPIVPCNLVGAKWLGIKQALGLFEQEENFRSLAVAIATRSPKLAVFWLAVIWNGEESQAVKCALSPLAPNSLLITSWTGISQSFLQFEYRHTITDRLDLIPHAREFTTSYHSRPEVLKPFARAPPFGTTKIQNLSLEVREHLDHNHRPLQWRSCWRSKTGETMLAHGPKHVHSTEISLLQPANVEDIESKISKDHQLLADDVSANASYNIFYWHSNNKEGSLWLDDETEVNMDVVKKLRSDPWVFYAWSQDEESDDDKKSEKDTPDKDKIKEWQRGVRSSSEER